MKNELMNGYDFLNELLKLAKVEDKCDKKCACKKEEDTADLYDELCDIVAVAVDYDTEVLKKCLKDTSKEAAAKLKLIADTIDEIATEPDPVEEAIKKLKAGETLELETDLLDEVVDTLWQNEDNVCIEVRNNKIKLKH